MIFLNLFKDSLHVTREEESGIDSTNVDSIGFGQRRRMMYSSIIIRAKDRNTNNPVAYRAVEGVELF